MELMKETVALGLRGTELLNYGELGSPDMEAAREIGRFAKANGLLIPCLSVGVTLVGEARAINVPKIKKYAEICAELEIPYLHHTVVAGLKYSEEAGKLKASFDEGVEITAEIADYANKLGVKTLLEDQGFVVNGVENFGKFREAAGRCFDVLIDTGNICFVDETAGAFAEAFANDTPHMHVKEYHITKEAPEGASYYRTRDGMYLSNAVAGEGDIDYDRVKAAIKKANYRGVYSTEYSFKDKDEMNRTFEYLASVFGDM